jgi:hypothetical protein
MPNGLWLLRAGNGRQQSAVNVNGLLAISVAYQGAMRGAGLHCHGQPLLASARN